MIRQLIAEPSCRQIRRYSAVTRLARACRGFCPGPRMFSLLVLLVVLALPMVALAGDPTGAGTGNASAVPAAKPGEPTTQELTDAVGHTVISINFVWTLVACFLVMFMQAGFALAETGFTRAKNAAHTMAMNFMCYPLGMLGFWICGFALMMGGVGAVAALGGTGPLTSAFSVDIAGHTLNIFGHKGLFLSGDSYDVGVFTLFMFAMVFMDTAVTIPTGALAERWKWGSFVFFCFFMSMWAYPIFGNWVWGGGWLSQLGSQFGLGHGHVDFAGSSVVHMVGGVAALVGAYLVGPRIGKYGKDGKVNAIPGHHMPMAILGVFILAFGWFGFNAGSSLSGNDLRISVIAVNTMLASAGGAFSAMLVAKKWFGKPDLGLMANGMLAGLVAITAPCAFVTSVGAVAIGVIAGVLLVGAVYFIDHKLKIDDPVGAISVHGVNGAFGVLAVGLFADGSYGAGLNGVATPVIGLFYGGGFSQLIAQTIGTATCFIFVGASFFVYFKVADLILGNRVSAEEEIEGLDLAEVGVLAYPDFNLRPNTVASGSALEAADAPAREEESILVKAQTSTA
ncbi:MAG: ammonium transporter [Pyrinomonadaceae bacterium]|nr:ammonium transporter [Pyrinomonadaceae bacterium]